MGTVPASCPECGACPLTHDEEQKANAIDSYEPERVYCEACGWEAEHALEWVDLPF